MTIKNGVISSFDVGVSNVFGGGFHLQSVRVLENGTGVSMFSFFGDQSTIAASAINRNTTYGVVFYHGYLSMTDSSIRGNGSYGIY